MSKTSVYKVLRCQQCGEEVHYIVRSWNVNSCLTDDDISHIARLNIGTVKSDDCERCDGITAHMCTAFNRQPLDAAT